MPRLNPISLRYNKEEMSFFKNHKYQIVHCHMDCMSAFPLGMQKEWEFLYGSLIPIVKIKIKI